MKASSLMVVSAMAMCIWSCTGRGGDSDGASVPRPKAYHRIEIPAERYDTVNVTGVDIVKNAEAVFVDKKEGDASGWFDIVYPSLGNATMYCSITLIDSSNAENVISNRTERMSLNTGGNRTEISEFVTPAGYECTVLVTPAGTLTPVQFIAAGGERVVSGTLMINAPQGFRPDSIAPVTEAVRRDVEVMLNSLR
ncbi:MAG: hypothetical protein NC098_08645 [Lachnoclostridium sp.]|nr:hypothetical protein [Lachnoclostridium sp.]